jgi:DNA (cytosine-5)-methyltransferase 1
MTPQAFFDFVGADAAKRFRKGILPFVDLFAGGGGTSSGVRIAMREMGITIQLAAVNHWDCAIATHERNHKGDLHFCTGVDRVDIEDLLSESDSDGIYGLLASPSCVTFSEARGAVPLNPQDRSGCWAVVKWMRTRRPIFLWVENVKAFLDYGPLMQKRGKDGGFVFLQKDTKGHWREVPSPEKKPVGVSTRRWLAQVETEYGLKPAMIQDPKGKGLYFKKWVRAIRRLGYDVEWRVLNAADYGAPTKRLRLILHAVRRSTGLKLVWPNPTHAELDEFGHIPFGLVPWRTARECIDWSDIGTSIFTRKKNLADKTIDRVAVGLIKFGLKAAVVKLKGTGTANSVDDPLGTVQANGLHYGLMSPEVLGAKGEAPASMIVGVGGPTGSARAQPTTAPLGTVIGENHRGVASVFALPDTPQAGVRSTAFTPFLVVTNHGNGPEGDDANNRRAKSLDQPMDTVTGSNSLSLISGVVSGKAEGEVPVEVHNWRELSAAIKAGIARCKSEPGYRPFISYCGAVFRLEVRFRMLNWRELATAQSFAESYEFGGTSTENVKMIGNAVPPALARAVVKAAISQNPNIGVMEFDEAECAQIPA